MAKISVVINTLNEEKNLPRALASIKGLADEVVVVDMHSDDKTTLVAQEAGCRVYEFKRVGYVEPARNYAIKKASGEWILVLDADEEVGGQLKERLNKIVEKAKGDYYRIARKNIIFGKWLRYTRWWPDYNIRFFRKGSVVWNEGIHSIPLTKGRGIDLPAKEGLALVHNNYETLEQYLERMNRYTTIQAETLVKEGKKFIWKDLLVKPLSEFLSRFLAGEGYRDGLHGLALSFLQAFSEVVLCLKVWQNEKFLEQSISPKEVGEEFEKAGEEVNWWLKETGIKPKGLASIVKKVMKK